MCIRDRSLPVLTQLHGLGQAAHCQPCCALLRKNAGTLHSAVAIAVGLDHLSLIHISMWLVGSTVVVESTTMLFSSSPST